MLTLKSAGAASLLLFMSIPFFVSADSSCPTLTRSLSRGTSGEDVRQLQRFLIDEGELLSGNRTGYFGPLTEEAVGNWQISKRVVSSRDPELGFGFVGPRTRAAIAAFCGGINSGNTGNTNAGGNPFSFSSGTAGSDASPGSAGKCAFVPPPKTTCATSWQGRRDSNGCVSSWYCTAIFTSNLVISSSATSTGNKPPTITNFSGPSSLGTGETGTWSVAAQDPEGSALSYNFAWGDGGGSAFEQIQQFGQQFQTSPLSTHSYTLPSIYSITVTVRDPAGNSVEVSTVVSVTSATSFTSAATTTNYGTGSNTPCSPWSLAGCTNISATSSSVWGSQYWCMNGIGDVGYGSATPCPSATSTNPFGSSANVQEGALCAPEGRQEFIACPYMANCMGGGTYLVCRNNVWTRLY